MHFFKFDKSPPPCYKGLHAYFQKNLSCICTLPVRSQQFISEIQNISFWMNLWKEWIKDALETDKTIVAVSHMYTPFLSIASHAVTVDKGKIFQIQNLPSDESEKHNILDALARGTFISHHL